MKRKIVTFSMFCSLFIFAIPSYAGSHSSFERFGDIAQVALPTAALGMAAYQRDLDGAYQWTYAGLLTLSSVQLLKHTVHSTRPNGHDQSFPSGHTAAAFWGAGFIQMRYGWQYGAPAYALAGLTGYSRVQTKNHWARDVVAGMLIGLGANKLFTTPYSSKLIIAPYINPESKEQGISLKADLG